MGSEFRRIHPFSATLASPSGPHTGLPGTSGAFVLVPSALPLPWRWGHKSCLLLLHRGAVIYACPAGIVNFFLMFEICHSKGGRGVSGSLWSSSCCQTCPRCLSRAMARARDPCSPARLCRALLGPGENGSKSLRLMLTPWPGHCLIPETKSSSCVPRLSLHLPTFLFVFPCLA